ncbi:hypothetical protein ACH4PW_31590 [Streptomyces sp. NPDC017082]|uniref:hypothetical protein n=1 Tax=Streptomyces sp. NPDC017082 TaxID=3364974 RepID=UPI0037B8B9B8
MRHNGRAPLKASQMRPQHLSLRDNEPVLVVCPDCDTWHRLKRSMILPHRDGTTTTEKTERRYLGDKPSGGRRCAGSAQRVVIDITAEEWGRRLLEADSTATGRRSARQHSKPLPAPAAPVHRLASMPGPSARLLAARRRARAAVNEHRSECGVCRTGRARCSAGRELEIRMGHTDATVRLAYEQHETAVRAVAASAIPRTQQWRRVDSPVKRADRQRRVQPIGDVPLESPPVPMEPVRINA